MSENTKTFLIIAAVAIGGYLVYKKFTGGIKAPPATAAGGNASTAAATINQGNFWNQLGAVGTGLTNTLNNVESGANSVYDLFAGSGNTGSSAPAPIPVGTP